MRKLIYLVLILTALWCGYWFVGATAAKRGIAAWFAEQRASGLTASYDELSVRGFPNRFDATLTGLHLADPRDGTGWRAPFFQVFALSYKPHHLIAVWPHEQVLDLPGGPLTVRSEDMRASAVFVPGPAFVLDRTSLEIAALSAGADGAGWGAERFRFATRRAAGSDAAHDLFIEAAEARLPPALRAQLDPAATLPEVIDRLHLDVLLDLDRPIDRHALEAPPRLTAIALRDLSLHWGELGLALAGDLRAGADGAPDGELTVTADNWRGLVGLAVAAGLLREEDRAVTETALVLLAGMSGDDPDRLVAPLTFADGTMSLGPIPLGPAPRLFLP